LNVESSSAQKEDTMKESEPMTMRPATGLAKRTSLTRCKIGLLGIFGICISVVALATPGAGVLFNVISRATVGPFHVESESGPTGKSGERENEKSWEVELQAQGISDIVTQTITFAPGGFTGWHSHPGPALLSIKSGTLTFYVASDPTCTPHVFPAGTGFVEPGGDVHFARNEGTADLTLNVTYIVPQSAPQRMDQPTPGNCPF
jgi:quercetin dioxygenase-like cupin family protein